MIQDIAPHKLDNHYYPEKTPDKVSRLIFTEGTDILYKVENNQIIFPFFMDIDPKDLDIRYLFSVDEQEFFLVFDPQYSESYASASSPYSKVLFSLIDKGFEFKNRMTLRAFEPQHIAYAGAVAHQIASWYADNRICGRCGQVLKHDSKERMMRCEACGNMIFPKICPGAITAIVDGDRILLTKYSAGFRNFALVAGFTESGETIEETVHREVMEEVGLKVKNLRYYKCQPWAFTDTLLFGFFCEPETRSINMDAEELSFANWVHRDELKDWSDEGTSLTSEMIRVFKENKVPK